MRILAVGGTGFIGRWVIRSLDAAGHHVTVLHRGKTSPDLPARVDRLFGNLSEIRDLTLHLGPDVVLDMICADEAQARALVDAFRGQARRLVIVSSGDVYRAFDVLHGKDLRLQDVPIREEDELRSSRYPYREGPSVPFDWLTPDYDKVLVEAAVTQDPALPATILRLPMVYGPGDPLHRFRNWLRQMDEGRDSILLEETAARWNGCWGYVENVGAAITLAVLEQRAAGRIYNVADDGAPPMARLLEELGRAAGWSGTIEPTPKDRMPSDQVIPGNYEQHWTLDTSRIREELGYRELVPRDEALARTVAWERSER